MKPVLFNISEDRNIASNLPNMIQQSMSDEKAKILLSYPIVYIHYWPGRIIEYTDKHGNNHSKQLFNVYVGESNDVVSRTKEHYLAGEKQKTWQHALKYEARNPQMVVIGHEHFNKSFTLDIENRLIEYMMSSVGSVEKSHNGRGNPQNGYYPSEEFNEVFCQIWRKLRKIDKSLFLSEAEIEKSALFKASPLKKLNEEQINAKETILAKIFEALKNGSENQLIFVQGEAGTGKTVLNASLFYDICTNGKELMGRDVDCHLMVNHDQQVTVYEQIAKRLNLGDGRIHKPTSFINTHRPENKVDISFIDEGHLLLTQGKMSYRGKNQLADIIERSRVTVVMFDEYQVLTAEEYWEPEVLEYFKNLSYLQGNMVYLSQQLRMKDAADTTIKWLNDFVVHRTILPFPPDPNYDLRVFDSPEELEHAIREKAESEDDKLSRIIASYDWEYKAEESPSNDNYWGVRIGTWFKPWNYQTSSQLTPKEKKANKHLAWAEQPHTINEVGSTFTIQGFDLAYAGVILGPSVKYRNGEVIFDPSESFNEKAIQKRTLANGTRKSFGETFIRNEVKVLLSRGVKGLYIYACDSELRKVLREKVNNNVAND